MFFIRSIIQVALFFALSSCVGTVDQGEPEHTGFREPQATSFTYGGILNARAISHDKIEIDFLPAGSSAEFSHHLYINDAATPVDLHFETIQQIDGGVYRYVLKGRSINTSYKLKITAVNLETGEKSSGETEKVIKTFDNTTADFNGVARVTGIPGQTSTSVKVDWNPAKFVGVISATAYDPVYYMVSWISEEGGAKNLNNEDYDGTDKFELRVPSSGFIGPSNHPSEVTISSLNPDTTYYFQVRAVHKTWNDYNDIDPSNVPVSIEKNTIYITHKTDAGGGAVDFNKQSLVVTKAPGNQSFNGMRFNWSYGEGTYSHYRLFVKEFAGGDVENEDELPKTSLLAASANLNQPCTIVAEEDGIVEVNLPTPVKDDSSKIACFDVPSTVTNVQINNLNPYKFYQAKVALCLNGACELEDGQPNQGILGDIVYERTSPVLAPFDGINSIRQPKEALDTIELDFNSVVTSKGYANTLEVYCIDPNNFSNSFLMSASGVPLTGTGTYCDGAKVSTVDDYDLSTINNYGQISTVTRLKISGITTINTDPSANYCFGMTPSITGSEAPEGEIRIDPADWVVRCIQPELKLPTIEEFAGVTGGCSVSENDVSFGWAEPEGGLYDDFTVIYKEKNTNVFTFSNALNGDTDYTIVSNVSSLSTTVNDLEPGKIYEFGVLATLDNSGTPLYSEPNVSIAECYVPLPVATFKEWTRVFAIGPKVDGRIPTKNYTDDDNDWPNFRTSDLNASDIESRIFEGVSLEGIPFEVDSSALSNGASYFSVPPGEDNGDFNPGNPKTYDGAPSAAGVPASNTGIVSLAWKEVDLNFMSSDFQANQDTESNDRSIRTNGYRVYRSHDYGNSWIKISGDNLVNTISYSYYQRSNASAVNERMGFFTDYSARHLYDVANISRARVYLYKIVPVFNGRELVYSGGGNQPHNVIRVTLPPPNMALVHRKMSNRTQCLELGKNIEHGNNYVCPYNGLGARARGIPWQVGQTVIDLGGDLLVDRFELGCNITRGSITGGSGTEYKVGNSFFDLDDVEGPEGVGVLSDTAVFEGSANNGSPFRGCRPPEWGSSALENIGSRVTSEANPYGGSNPDYKKVLFGDCVGMNDPWVPIQKDWDGTDTLTPGNVNIVTPGARYTGPYNPTVDDPNSPHYVKDNSDSPGLFGVDMRKHTIAQAEFGAVYYNKSQNSGLVVAPRGPGYSGSDTGVSLISSDVNVSQKCSINLASIGNDGKWSSRWFAPNFMGSVTVKDNTEVGSSGAAKKNISDFTLSEIVNSRGLYDDYEPDSSDRYFASVPQSFWDKDRIHEDMPLARVFSSNSAKLPPLTGVPKETFSKICSTYQVQVGLADDTGAFQAFGAPKQKRVMRRNEFITSSKFSEVFDNDLIGQIEKGENPVSGGRVFNGCNGQSKTTSSVQAEYVGDEFNSAFSMPLGETEGLFLTGSGDPGESTSTQACTSRYGVQDLIGNHNEMGTEEVFCDYSADAMGIFFGKENDVAQSVVSPYTNAGSHDRFYILQDAYICYEEYAPTPAPSDCPDCTWSDPDGDGTFNWCLTSGLQIWRKLSSYSGYCSVVDSNSTKVDDPLNYRDLSQVMEPIYLPDGSLNPGPISVGKQYDNDQESVDRMRNGDGYFLNFGESNLAPSFKVGGGLDFEDGLGKYFNTILGIPLTCASYGSIDSCGSSASDNLNVTLEGMWDNHNAGGSAPGLSIDNFPVGNSNGSNIGLSDTEGSFSPVTINPNANSPNKLVTGFHKAADGSVTPVLVDQGVDSEIGFQLHWELNRGTVLSLYNGGSYDTGGTGAFNLSIKSYTSARSSRVGSRCAVMINEDY